MPSPLRTFWETFFSCPLILLNGEQLPLRNVINVIGDVGSVVDDDINEWTAITLGGGGGGGGSAPGAPDDSLQFRLNATTFVGDQFWKRLAPGRVHVTPSGFITLGDAGGAFPTNGFIRVPELGEETQIVVSSSIGDENFKVLSVTGNITLLGDSTALTNVVGDQVGVFAGVVGVTAATGATFTSGGDLTMTSDGVMLTRGNWDSTSKVRNLANDGDLTVWSTFDDQDISALTWQTLLIGTPRDGFDTEFDQVQAYGKRAVGLFVTGEDPDLFDGIAHASVQVSGYDAFGDGSEERGVSIHPNLAWGETKAPTDVVGWGGGLGIMYARKRTADPTGDPDDGIWASVEDETFDFGYQRPDGSFVKAVGATTRLIMSGGEAVADNTNHALTFTSAPRDDDGMWSGAAPTRATIQRDGSYLVTIEGNWEPDGNGERIARVLKNAATELFADNRDDITSGSVGVSCAAASVVELVAGDYLRFNAAQVSGSSQSIIGAMTVTRVA